MQIKISKVLPHLSALDKEIPDVEMVKEEQNSLASIRSRITNLRYDVTYTFSLSYEDFHKTLEE